MNINSHSIQFCEMRKQVTAINFMLLAYINNASKNEDKKKQKLNSAFLSRVILKINRLNHIAREEYQRFQP